MSSTYLSKLSENEKEDLIASLHAIQSGSCFICGDPIDLVAHKGHLDIDHVNPTSLNGKDDPKNFALTHSSCNRSKQDSNLEVSRILHQFYRIKEKLSSENRSPNLNDILHIKGGSQYEIKLICENDRIKYSFPDLGKNTIESAEIYKDEISGFEYCFMLLPIEYLFHDDKINPRSIGANISKLIKEFHLHRPQLHISLAWVDITENQRTQVKVFDGQHKAAAQILLGARKLPVRVFINPDRDVLLTTNTNAGTKLRQVAFDKSIQRHLGSQLYFDRIKRFQSETGREDDDYSFSERDLQNFFKGESLEVKRYILDAVRDSITHNPENKLKDYIDFGGRGKERPLSYSVVEKTFYSFFIYQGVLDTPIDLGLDDGNNPRELEKEQILRLQNIIAEEIYSGKFDLDIGTYQIESRIQKGDEFPLKHLLAFRLSKEEILYNWLRYASQIIQQAFIIQGHPIDNNKIFQTKFPDIIWEHLRKYISNLTQMSIWVNKDLSTTVFGGKQNYDFWQKIFETGKSPQGQQVLPKPINLLEMIQK